MSDFFENDFGEDDSNGSNLQLLNDSLNFETEVASEGIESNRVGKGKKKQFNWTDSKKNVVVAIATINKINEVTSGETMKEKWDKIAATLNQHRDFVGHSFTGEHLMKTFSSWRRTTSSKFALDKPGSNLSGLPQRDELPRWEQTIMNMLTAAHEKSQENTRKAFKDATRNSNMLTAETIVLCSSSGGEAGAAAASSAKDDSDNLISEITSKAAKKGFDLHSKRSRFNTPVSDTSSLAASISIDADDDETAIDEIALEREKLQDRVAEREYLRMMAEADRQDRFDRESRERAERIDRELRDRAERQAEREAERAERQADPKQQIDFQNRMLELSN